MKRSDLPDNVFGIPEERKYPMLDKKHTLSAIKLFGHVEDKYEKELANNIIKNMKKFNISNDVVGDNNKLKKYLKEGYEDTDDTFIVDECLTVDDGDEYIEEGTFNQIIMQLPIQKYNIQHKTPINNVADLIKYHKNPGLDNYVAKCKNADDLSYLKRDTRTVIPTLKKIRDRITECKKGETNKNKGYYKNIKKKYLDNDLSEKDVDLTLTWVNDVCKRITNKIKQLQKGITTEAVAGIGTVVGTNTCEPIYIVNYMQNNVFSGSHQERFGICKAGMKDLHTVGGKYNKLHYTELDEFEKEAENIKVYRYNGNINKSFYSIIEDAENDLDLYTMLTGQPITSRSDIEKNGDFIRETYIRDELSAIQECVYATAMADTINEAYIKNEPDIYYNKNKFDSGEINLCFITGHSGSGKSTMGRNMQKDNVEHYELDDLHCIADHFTMAQLKKYGDLIYSYFNGKGKKFYIGVNDLGDIPQSEYEDILYVDFVHYAMNYAKLHKNTKYVVEGIWLFVGTSDGKPFFTPNEFKDYAFYIKGTSMIISKHRGAKRDAKFSTKNKIVQTKNYLRQMLYSNWKYYFINEKQINTFRKYFSNLITQSSNESTIIESSSSFIPYEIPLLGINEDGRSYNYYRDLDGVYAKNELTGLRCKSYDSVEDISEAVLDLVRKGVY